MEKIDEDNFVYVSPGEYHTEHHLHCSPRKIILNTPRKGRIYSRAVTAAESKNYKESQKYEDEWRELRISDEYFIYVKLESLCREKICVVCGNPATDICGGCRGIVYCSRECQNKDWKSHKEHCVKKHKGISMYSVDTSERKEIIPEPTGRWFN